MRKINLLYRLTAILILLVKQVECQPTIKSDSIYVYQYRAQIDSNVELKLRGRLIDIVYERDMIKSQVYQYLDNGIWINTWKYINEYNVNGNQTVELSQTWNNEEWQNSEQRAMKYDSRGNEIERVQSQWDDDKWEYDYKSLTEWNQDDLKISSTSMRWDGSHWIYQEKVIRSYTVAGNVDTLVNYQWIYGFWVNDTRYTFKYNQTNLIESVYEVWNDNNWRKQDKKISIYDTLGFLSFTMGYSWDLSNLDWRLSDRAIYEYLPNNKMVSTYQYGNEDNWVNFYRHFWTITDNGNMLDREEEWEHGSWWPRHDIKRYLDDKDSMYTYVTKRWDLSNKLTSWDSTYWHSASPLGEEEFKMSLHNLLLFPNPSDGIFRISTDSELLSVTVYNLQGQTVYTGHLEDTRSKEIDLESLPVGIYYIDTFDGSERRTGKIIIK
ncbi:MAG TPA: T9SS type A sorting domain-containing protein [Lentimicrobium sp.]|nr:T9SS type A sorting domain-containing protein [Lentimicrobium sp.]